jgi:hypothetical protein
MDRHRPREGCEHFRQDGAGLLVAVAVLGLVVLPLLHAEEHYRDAHPDEEELAALVEEWEAGSRDPFDVLAGALRRVHQSHPPGPARHEHQEHSHGPGGAPHGSGSLMHLALALHAAPQLPQLAPCPAAHPAPQPLAAQLRGTVAYLVPKWSQGPPGLC